MAILTAFYGSGTATGEAIKIEYHVPVLGWEDVGSGSYTAVSEYSVTFVGEVDKVVHESIDSTVTLTDENPTSTSGPCTVIINGDTYTDGTYQVDGSTLAIKYDAAKHSYSIEPDGTTTSIDSDGKTVHLSPR